MNIPCIGCARRGGLMLLVILAGCGSGQPDAVKDAKKTNARKIDSQKTVERPEDSSAIPLSKPDADFLVEAASKSQLATEMGRLAADRSSNPRIKAFGMMIVRDQTMIGERARALANANHISLAESLSNLQQKVLSELRTRTGDDFDKEYVQRTASDDMDDIHAFQDHSKTGSPVITVFASNGVHMLQRHLDSAENLKQMLRLRP